MCIGRSGTELGVLYLYLGNLCSLVAQSAAVSLDGTRASAARPGGRIWLGKDMFAGRAVNNTSGTPWPVRHDGSTSRIWCTKMGCVTPYYTVLVEISVVRVQAGCQAARSRGGMSNSLVELCSEP